MTLAVVLVAGMATALVMVTRERGDRRDEGLLAAITSDEGSVRRAAWADLADHGSPPPRDEIMATLADPGLDPGVLADAARGCLELDWPIEPDHAIAAGRLADAEPFLAWFGSAFRADPAALEIAAPAIQAMLGDDRRSCDDLMAILVEALGTPPDREIARRLAGIVDAGDRPATTRVRLALGRLGVVSPSVAEPDVISSTRTLLADPAIDDERVLAATPTWALAGGGDAARSWLEGRADAGDPDAKRAVGLGDPRRVSRAERAVLADPDFGYERRTLAAFRLLDAGDAPGDAAILNLLDDGPTDADGTVHAAALLAWRGLSTTARARLMRRWLDSEDEDRRRAGMLLAVLAHRLGGLELDADIVGDLDRTATDLEASPRLRRTARLATRVLDRWPHADLDAAAYAARTTRLDDGRLDADSVLLGLLAGDESASRRLTASPRPAPGPDEERAAAFARDLAWRRAMLSSLAPDRLHRVGEPIPGDETDLRLWIDALAAERLVSGPFHPPPPIAESASTDETPSP